MVQTINIELTKEQLDRILDALDYQFDLTDNVEEDVANKELALEIVCQWDNQQ